MQQALKDLEAQLDKLLGKGSPYRLSDRTKQELAGGGWAIALVLGILQVWGALVFWHIGHLVTQQTSYNGYTYQVTATTSPGFFYYTSFLVIAIDAAMILLATPQLKDFRRQGWELAYYALLVELIYAFLRIFSNVGGGFGQFIVQLFFSAVIGYFLFQVRDIFVSGKTKVTVPPAKHPGREVEVIPAKHPEEEKPAHSEKPEHTN